MEEHGGCEHVTDDPSKGHVVHYENDYWGREGFVMCEVCEEAKEIEMDNEEVCCYDCKGVFQRKDTVEWKWYDFYPAQGDEPIVVCKHCRILPKHLERVRKDREDYEREFEEDTSY